MDMLLVQIPERGVYKTIDGGKTWEKVLFKSDKAGVIDLVMNPSNPDELFAAIWEFERKAWGPKNRWPGKWYVEIYGRRRNMERNHLQ